jgi:hypothetical protein
MEGDNILVALRDLLQNSDLVADHVLPTLHELLVDDLAGIVVVRANMHGFFDDGIGTAAKRLSCPVLCLEWARIDLTRDKAEDTGPDMEPWWVQEGTFELTCESYVAEEGSVEQTMREVERSTKQIGLAQTFMSWLKAGA